MFDTLLYTKKLEASGASREMAEAQINVMMEMIVDGVATKQDLSEVKTELKQEITAFRTELKQEIADLRAESKQEIAELGADFKQDRVLLRADFLNLESRLTLKLGAMIFGAVTIILAFLGAFPRVN